MLLLCKIRAQKCIFSCPPTALCVTMSLEEEQNRNPLEIHFRLLIVNPLVMMIFFNNVSVSDDPDDKGCLNPTYEC